MRSAAGSRLRPRARDAAARLAAAGSGSPALDADLLLAHVLGVDRSALILDPDRLLTPEEDKAFEALLVRREAHEPVAYILGRKGFRRIELAVDRRVLVPRPETELLVDAVLPVLRAVTEPVAVDLCSGSGALALAIADEVPAARVIAVEGDSDAASWLARNAKRTRVEVRIGDVADADVVHDLAGQVHAVVCNPPYVPTGTNVADEVRFDPEHAVFAGPDGLSLMPDVVARAAELLRSGGVLALEHDDSHERAVRELLSADGGWRDIADHRDLAGRPRYATAVRS
jgi:release factor glutamine methyltransferase